VDQEVGGSSPPSCTSKIKWLAASCITRELHVSALCPHSQCGTTLRHCRKRKGYAERKAFMSEEQDVQERSCLHCMMVELIDDFLAEHPATAGSDKVDTSEADEVIEAIAKTVAELTSQQDGVVRRQVIEQLMQQIMHYDGEFRREDAANVIGSHARH
jgi:hypothetical protein